MIEVYPNGDGGKVKVFFVVDDGNVTSVKMGNRVVPVESGYQFYVDKYIAQQIDKIDIDFSDGKPVLVVKEGQKIEEPEMTEKEKEIERLKQELEELKNDE